MLLRIWHGFTAWRRGRPFWAGLFVAIGAIIILFPPFVGVKLGDMIISIKTIGGVSALLIGTLLLICAAALWVQPRFRLASGIVTVLLSLVALVTTNLGGFLLGTIFALLGGALAVAWTDEAKPPKKRKRQATETQPLAAVALVALLALQPPSSTEPPPSSSAPAPTSSVAPTSSAAPTSSSTAPPSSSTPPMSSNVPVPPSSGTAPPPTSATPPPAPAPVAGGGREWTLNASRLDLGGLNFVGVVDALLNGQTIKVLKFTANDMKIKDLVQTAEVAPGVKLVTKAAPGSTSTVSPGRIELYTVQLKGNLDILGIKIPVDYSAAHPPPLNVPFVTFTEVTVRNTDLVGGNLKIPGAKISIVTS